MTPEFLQEITWIIRIRDTTLLQNHSSNIYTSTARHMHVLDQATRVTGSFIIIDSSVIYDKLL